MPVPHSQIITSLSHEIVKTVKQILSKKKHRSHYFILEHEPSLLEFCQKPGYVDTLVIREDMAVPSTCHRSIKTVVVAAKVFNALTQIKTSKGYLGIMVRPLFTLGEDLTLPVNLSTESEGLVNTVLFKPSPNEQTTSRYSFFLDGIQQPSNIGAMVRNAAAFRCNAVYVGDGSADPFHPDAVRAMAGSCYATPIVHTTIQDLITKLGQNVTVVALHLHPESIPFSKAALVSPLVPPSKPTHVSSSTVNTTLFVFGSEGNGISDATLHALNKASSKGSINVMHMYIPVHQVESLNVAATSAIVGYEMSR